MKQPDAYAEWTISGYVGWYRPCWKASHQPVKRRNDKGELVPEYFKSEAAAECAAWRKLRQIEMPIMRRDGAKIEASSAGDALFPGLEPIFRKGKRIEVERKGAAA